MNNTTNSATSTLTVDQLSAAHQATEDMNLANRGTDASAVDATIKASRKAAKVAKTATRVKPTLTKDERILLNKQRQAERLQKIQDKIARQEAKEAEKEARDRQAAIEHNIKTIEAANTKIARLEARVEKRSGLLVNITTEILEKQNSFNAKVEKYQSQVSQNKTKSNRISREDKIAQIKWTMDENYRKIAKIEARNVALQARLTELENSTVSVTVENEATDTREKFLQTLQSGINSRMNYRTELMERQDKDLAAIETERAFIAKLTSINA